MPTVNIIRLGLSNSNGTCYVNWKVEITCDTDEVALETPMRLNFEIIGVDVAFDDSMGTHPNVSQFVCEGTFQLEGSTQVPCSEFNEDWGTDELKFRFFVTRQSATNTWVEVPGSTAHTHTTWE